MGKSSDPKSRKVTPPSPSYMSNDQFANYLAELRQNRISRPGGARPQPAGTRPAPSRSSFSQQNSDAASKAESLPTPRRTPSQAPSDGAGSMNSRYTTSSAFVRGRDYYPTSKSTSPLKPSDVVPTATYMERGQRWMEKEEAHSLRDAMDDMTIRESPEQKPSEDDETRLYNAALDEAAELVWKHQNGVKPPEPDAPYRYRPHLRKNSYAHARTASIGPYGDGVAASGLARDELSRSASASSSDDEGQSRINRPSIDSSRSQDSRNAKSHGGMNNRPGSYVDARRRSSMRRNISGEVERPFSGDQIWEEPENSSIHGSVNASGTPIAALSSKPDNSRVRFQATVEDVPDVEDQKPSDRVNIHRNAPSQSRNPLYTTNTPSPAGRPSEDVERKNGMEVRSQELREATTRSLKDRSGRLPEPTAVSDSPGRPITDADRPNNNTKQPQRTAAPGRASNGHRVWESLLSLWRRKILRPFRVYRQSA
ncbi:hypothetical protein N3K66_006067 [Trichothecium roseum]|uniref:Uncharacterized protein n=1 Tax=Trichothecium roseum TaxID=47278 RepID=A0ACC0V063_9HYPO|nr:hypothetical protein N3K66_006067 [Trichothecium roseum]